MKEKTLNNLKKQYSEGYKKNKKINYKFISSYFKNKSTSVFNQRNYT